MDFVERRHQVICAFLLIAFGLSGKVVSKVIPTVEAYTVTGNTVGDKKQALFDLKELLNAGILDSEEFDVENRKILNS